MRFFEATYCFEHYLGQKEGSSIQDSSLDFLFYFFKELPSDCLVVDETPSASYIRYLYEVWSIEANYIKRDQLPGEAKVFNWWTYKIDREKEIFRNSKLTSLEFSKTVLHDPFPAFVSPDHLKEIEQESLDAGKWVIKDPLGFSGRWMIQVSSEQLLAKMRKFDRKVIVEKWVDRVVDLGIHIEKDKTLPYQLFCNKKGHFQGAIYPAETRWQELMAEFFDQDRCREILNYFQTSRLQVDSMVYRDPAGVEHFRAVSEVNHRITMTSFFHLALRLFAKKYDFHGIWSLNRSKNLSFSQVYDQCQSLSRDGAFVCPLNDMSSKMFFYIASDSRQRVFETIQELSI